MKIKEGKAHNIQCPAYDCSALVPVVSVQYQHAYSLPYSCYVSHGTIWENLIWNQHFILGEHFFNPPDLRV